MPRTPILADPCPLVPGDRSRPSDLAAAPYSVSIAACSSSHTSHTRLKNRSGRMYDFQSVRSTGLPPEDVGRLPEVRLELRERTRPRPRRLGQLR